MKTKYWAIIYFTIPIISIIIFVMLALQNAVVPTYVGPYSVWLWIGAMVFVVELLVLTYFIGSKVWVSEEERP